MSTSVATDAGHLEHARDGRRRQPVDHDRAEDRHEHDREDLVRAGDPFSASCRTERGRRRAGDDAARRHPRDESPLARSERRAERRSATAAGRITRIMTATRASASGITERTSSGETEAATRMNSTPDEQLDERLLELEEREADVDVPLIADSDPHEHRGQEPRVLADQVGGDDSCHDDHQRGRDDHPRRASMGFAEEEP